MSNLIEAAPRGHTPLFRVRKFCLATLLFLAVSPLHAVEHPQNLGLGLDKLVESRALIKKDPTRAVYNGFATQQAADYASLAITDALSDRVKVDIVPTGKVDVAALKAVLQNTIPSFTATAVENKYRGVGMIEGYVSVDDAEAVATTAGVRSVFLALKPYLRSRAGSAPSVVPGDHLNKIGTAFDQGVIQHRVDRINQLYNPSAPVNYDGTGMSIGLLSDSFDTRSAAPHAATGVANFDLPGDPANPWNTQPVVVLQDEPGGTDEGRGMTEIAYKMAPKARLAFATADEGEVGFANNIRALAGIPGFTYDPSIQQGFKADAISDDVGYFDEPWYEDGIISDGVDDAAAAGVAYFSSAGNDIGINGYESPLRIVPNDPTASGGLTFAAGNQALINTNINLTGVPPALYAGGFHNFNPAAGQQDVAQLTNVSGTQIVVMQWDDPYDTSNLTLDEPPIFTADGTITSATPVIYGAPDGLPAFTQGQAYVITETATSGNFDAIITILDASNNAILVQDTGVDETVNFYPPATGQYQIQVGRFGTTTGNFHIEVNTADGTAGVTTDLNLLVFNSSGAYVASQSLTANNLATNRPIELGQFGFGATKQIQFVIARANTPAQAPSQLPTRVRWLIPGNGAGNLGPAEYFTYNTVTTGGHATAAGGNGVAAYSVFKPNVPEVYTSPGPATILFDKNSNRLAVPDVRQQPRVAAADAGNTSFFTSDSSGDLDTNPNFAGTSAAGPHAAAIAALVLQSRGGPGSVTPGQMTSILQASAFPHDLDPSFASGSATTSDGGGVSITISSDGESNNGTGQNDTSSFQVTYAGPGSLASLTFNPAGADVAGGNVTGGNNGPKDDTPPATISYFENSFPGLAFLPATKAFTLGPLSGLSATDVTAPTSVSPFTGFSNLAPPPANGTSQFRTMTISFPTGNFTSGKVVRFTVGRGAQHSASVGTVAVPVNGTVTINQQADLFGGGVLIPDGTVIASGMTFSGTTTAGGTFSGMIKNNIGAGYSVVDGYGFIDASVATGVISRSLVGAGAATPSFASVGGTTLFTVSVTPGSNPPSTGLYVVADLSSIGGSVSQQFFDDGTHGDLVAGDSIFSFNATVATGSATGSKTIPVSISDQQSRSGSASIGFSVLAPTPPTAALTAAPNSVAVTQSTLLTALVSPGTGPASTGITVTADLSSIGGSASQALTDDGNNGDVTAGDGTYSFSATVPLTATPGAKSIPVTVTDAQARSSTSSLGLTVLTPTSPSGTGNASPSTAAMTDTVLLTVTPSPGTNPDSTGLVVTADLSAIGGSSTQQLYDDGTNGDDTAGDGVYSFSATVALGTAAGDKSLPVTISDDQSRSGSTSIDLTVLAPTAIGASGSATPSAVIAGGSTHLVVSVTGGTSPASSGVQVTADLSAIGGSATQAFTDDGSGTSFSFDATVDAATTPGVKLLPATVTDTQGRTASVTIGLNVPTPGAPYATGIAASALPGNSVLLLVAVTPGTDPASTGLVVTVDLSAIGGSATQQFYDDGTNGDQTAADGVFSFQATVDPGTPIDTTLHLPVTVTDDQSRTGSGSISLKTLGDRIFADGFEGT